MSAPVMIIEGSPLRMKILAICLRREEIASREETASVSFSEGRTALQYLKRSSGEVPNVILLDGDLPRVYGRSVLGWLRSLPRLDQTAILVFTTRADAFHQMWMRWRGATHVLEKPFKTEDVMKLVFAYVQRVPVHASDAVYFSQGGRHAFSV